MELHVCFGFFLIFSFNSFFLSNFSSVDYVCLESHTTRQHAMDKLFLAPLVKNQNLAYQEDLDQESKVIYSLFCCMLSWLLSKYIETEFQSKSKTRVTNCELRVQIYELRVQIYESRVENHEFRVQIHELGD